MCRMYFLLPSCLDFSSFFQFLQPDNRMTEEHTKYINITDLPLNAQIEIFKFLSVEDLVYSVRFTCKLWNQLSFESTLWKTVDISQFTWTNFSDTSFLQLISDSKDSVETLKVDVKRLSLKAIAHEGVICRNLQEIFIGGVKDEDNSSLLQVLKILSEKYKYLKGLHLFEEINLFKERTLQNPDVNGSAHIQETLSELFPHLQSFSYSSSEEEILDDVSQVNTFFKRHSDLEHVLIKNSLLMDSWIFVLLCEMPILRTLDLTNSFSSQYFEGKVFEASLPNLKTLILDNCLLSDSLLTSILKGVRVLENLSLKAVQNITNVGLEYVALACPNLKHLYIGDTAWVSNITDAGIERVVEKCHCLTVLYLANCQELTDRSIQAIAANCTGLQELHVREIVALSDIAIISVADKCARLRTLDVSYCAKLTGKSVSFVIKHCKELRKLYTESCSRVTEFTLTDVSRTGRIENKHGLCTDDQVPCVHDDERKSEKYRDLESPYSAKVAGDIDYSESQHIVEGILNRPSLDITGGTPSLAADHSHIQQLDFRFCSNLTNACIIQISIYCRDLLSLNIQACHQITDAGITRLLTGCTRLICLDISGGSSFGRSRLTDKCLGDIAQFGQNLEELHMCKNSNITTHAVFNVAKECTKICKIYTDLNNYSLQRQSFVQCAGELAGKTTSVKFLHNTVEICIYRNKELDYISSL